MGRTGTTERHLNSAGNYPALGRPDLALLAERARRTPQIRPAADAEVDPAQNAGPRPDHSPRERLLERVAPLRPAPAGPTPRNMASALVTGANRGLGLETCRQLLSRGFSVLLGARDITLGRDAANLLARGGAVRAVELDIENPESIERLAAELEGQPPLDALVNNAGIALEGFDENVANRTIDVNYRGAVRVTDALLSRLAPDANIVMVSSGAGELTRVSLRSSLESCSTPRSVASV